MTTKPQVTSLWPQRYFCAAVHDHVCAQVERALEVAGEKRVVHDEDGACVVCEVRERGDVRDVHHGAGGGLEEEALRVALDRALDGVEVGEVHEIELDAVALRVHVDEQAVRTAVQVVAHEKTVAVLEHLEQGGDGRHAACVGVRLEPAFERCDRVLELEHRGVAASAVDKARRLVQGGVREGCRLVDGEGNRPGLRIAALVAVDGVHLEASVGMAGLVYAHQSLDLRRHCLETRIVHVLQAFLLHRWQ